MEASADVLFGELTAKIDSQDAALETAKKRVAEQEERMEVMEDMVTALAYTLKELTVAVDLREPQLTPGELRSRAASNIVGVVGKGMPMDLPPADDDKNAPIYGLCFGYLWKLSTGQGLRSHWNKRWFVLKNDGTATYFKTMADSTARDSQRTELDLSNYTVAAATDTGKPFGFRLISPLQRSFTLAPETETEENRTKWMDAFREVVKKQTGSNRRFRKTASIISIDASNRYSIALDNTATTATATGEELLASATLHGWLEFQRSPGKWTREYYAIVEKDVLQLSGEEATSVVSATSLQGAVIDVLWEDPPDEKELSFAIVAAGNSVVLNAENDEQMGQWVSTLTNLAQTN